MSTHLAAEHGIVCRLAGERLGYFGWPTVARLDDGTLVVASSGLRSGHVCPWGKTVLHESRDDGRTWSASRVINDSPLDDRDAGVLNLGRGKLLVSWFTSDARSRLDNPRMVARLAPDELALWRQTLDALTDEIVDRHIGSWVTRSDDAGATWGAPIRVRVTSPHGPNRLRNGDLVYLGKPFRTMAELEHATITALRSTDGGLTWQTAGEVPLYPGTIPSGYHEAHVLELPSGRLLGAIRLQNSSGENGDVTQAGLIHFSTLLTESDDGGRTWSTPHSVGYGSPPHLLQHRSGALVLTYGHRAEGPGQRAGISHDEGQTWTWDWIIRDDGPDSDLGYPSTVELGDGSLFTVYYQKAAAGEPCSLLWSRWQLP